MNCSNHPEVSAVASCERCGKALCEACRVELGEQSWCRECLTAVVYRGYYQPRRRRTSKLLAALLSIIPGTGHMYLGRIGKGFAMMGFLFAAVFLVILYSATTGMYWMTAYLIPTLSVLFLSYAVFDSIALAEELRDGVESSEDPIMEHVWNRILLNPRAAGYTLLIAGIIGVLSLFSVPINRWLREGLGVDFPVAALIIPIALVVIGAVLLRRGGRPRG